MTDKTRSAQYVGTNPAYYRSVTIDIVVTVLWQGFLQPDSNQILTKSWLMVIKYDSLFNSRQRLLERLV